MINNTDKFYFKAFGLTIQSPIPVRGLIPIDFVNKPDILILFENIEKYPELQVTKVNRKALNATFGMYDGNTNDAYMVWENQINFRLIDGKTMIVDTIEKDLDFLSLFIVSEPLGILLFQRGDILLHASAIKLPDGNGIVFMGEPGVGKSTTAAAFVKKGCKIISDDLVAIRLIDNKPYLIPSFPQIKLWQKSVEGLGYGYNEVKRIVEGTNKFAYFNENDFDLSAVPIVKILELGSDTNNKVSSSFIPIFLLKHFALPEQLLEKGIQLKNHFITSKTIANYIQIDENIKIRGFENLDNFINNILNLHPKKTKHF